MNIYDIFQTVAALSSIAMILVAIFQIKQYLYSLL